MGVLEDWPRPRVHLEDNILWPRPWPWPRRPLALALALASTMLSSNTSLCQSNRMHDAVVSKLIAASRGSSCDSMASCFAVRFVAKRYVLYNKSV